MKEQVGVSLVCVLTVLLWTAPVHGMRRKAPKRSLRISMTDSFVIEFPEGNLNR